jgi:hypothetical protein
LAIDGFPESGAATNRSLHNEESRPQRTTTYTRSAEPTRQATDLVHPGVTARPATANGSADNPAARCRSGKPRPPPLRQATVAPPGLSAALHVMEAHTGPMSQLGPVSHPDPTSHPNLTAALWTRASVQTSAAAGPLPSLPSSRLILRSHRSVSLCGPAVQTLRQTGRPSSLLPLSLLPVDLGEFAGAWPRRSTPAPIRTRRRREACPPSSTFLDVDLEEFARASPHRVQRLSA